jgi:hypothetical protein
MLAENGEIAKPEIPNQMEGDSHSNRKCEARWTFGGVGDDT